MPHEYKRNGTAALNVLDGSVVGRNMQRQRHQEFIRVVEAELPPDNAAHAIPHNCAMHSSPSRVNLWSATRAGRSTSCPRHAIFCNQQSAQTIAVKFWLDGAGGPVLRPSRQQNYIEARP